MLACLRFVRKWCLRGARRTFRRTLPGGGSEIESSGHLWWETNYCVLGFFLPNRPSSSPPASLGEVRLVPPGAARLLPTAPATSGTKTGFEVVPRIKKGKPFLDCPPS